MIPIGIIASSISKGVVIPPTIVVNFSWVGKPVYVAPVATDVNFNWS